MNAVNHLFREQQEARAAAAVAKARTWTETARPLLRAYTNLSEASADTYRFNGGEASEARDIITEACARLHDEIEGIRDRFIMAAQGPAPATSDTAEDPAWEAYDELCEVVGSETPTVDQALRASAAELVDEEMKRAA